MTSAAPDGAGPVVSICIPASRPSELLRAAIDSALGQTFDRLEVVVCDDSGGALEPLVRSFTDPRVRYFRNPSRLGMFGNSAETARRSTAPYIKWLHDDDELAPDFVEATLRAFGDDPAIGVVFTDCEIVGDAPPDAERARVRELTPGRHDDILPVLLRHNPIVPSAAILRRATWEQGEASWTLPRDISTTDTMIWIRAALGGWAFSYVPRKLVRYRVHDGQLSADELFFRDNTVALWERMTFERADAEALRRCRLAEALVDRAATKVKEGRGRSAREDLRRARRIAPAAERRRRSSLAVLAAHPALGRAAHVAWTRLRSRRAHDWF